MDDVVLTPEFKFNPYEYQMFPFEARALGVKRIILVWPRRAGKDLTLWNLMITQSQLRVGTYFYFFPSHKQAKRVIWDGMDDEGNSFRSYIPAGMIENENESELQITLVNGSIIQLVGADTIDTSALGTNCVGAVFSEYAVQHPRGWNYVRPILAKNGGWAAFAYTPRGHNHGFDLFDKNKENPDWAVSKLTADDLIGHNGERLWTEEMIDSERRSGMAEELIQQELYTSFSGIQQGSFFGDQCQNAWGEGRVGHFKHDPELPVFTASDLGVGLKFVTWFWQMVNEQPRFIDYEELEKGGIPEFAKMVKDKPYLYGGHFAPFDVKSTEIGTGLTRIESARKLGIHFRKVDKLAVSDRVELGRRVFPMATFDKTKTAKGWKALLNYRREYDEEKLEYSDKEVHDWASHGGSAFTYACVAIRRHMNRTEHGTQAETDFDEYHNEKVQESDGDFDPFDNSAEGDEDEDNY